MYRLYIMNSLQIRSKLDISRPFHIYYYLSALNFDQINGASSPNLIFQESRSSPYLKNPNDYYCAIERFSITTGTIPMFIPEVELNQANPNQLIYQMTVRDISGIHNMANVTYIPSDETIPQPTTLNSVQDLTNPYYYVYNMKSWINMLNSTLSGICTSISAPTTEPPFFAFTPSTALMSLYVPGSWTKEKIYVNNNLKPLFSGFKMSNVDTISGYMTSLDWSNDNNLNAVSLSGVTYYKIDQEAQSLDIMNPVDSINFTTGLFPIVQTLTSFPNTYGDQNLFSKGNNANQENIITDFKVSINAGNYYNNTITYTATGLYKLFDLYGSNPLNQILIKTMWKDKFQQYHDVQLQPGTRADINIMFRRKDYGNVFLDGY